MTLIRTLHGTGCLLTRPRLGKVKVTGLSHQGVGPPGPAAEPAAAAVGLGLTCPDAHDSWLPCK